MAEKKTQIHIMVTPEEKEKIMAFAQEKGWSISTMVRRGLSEIMTKEN